MIEVIPTIPDATGAYAIIGYRIDCRAGKSFVVLPEIPEPKMGKYMDLCRPGPPVDHRNPHKDVIHIGFGIFNITIEIGIVVKSIRVQQFILRMVLGPLVFFNQFSVGKFFMGVLVQILAIGMCWGRDLMKIEFLDIFPVIAL
jgi:hypothetical protein